MTKKITARITGWGSYLPKTILSNTDLEKMVDTSDEWITTRTGIKERRIAASDEFPSTMGAQAALEALREATLDPSSVDAIIVASMTPDYLSPATGALIQHLIGAKNAAAFDIQAACTGFLYGLSIAKGWIESGMYKNVLVIATEKNSAFVDYTDRSMCVLWGDGAGACVVSNTGKGYTICHSCLGADGEQAMLFVIPGGGSRNPTTAKTLQEKKHYMHMVGKEVFKHAVRRMESAVKECLEATGMSESDITWLIPHQANMRIIDAVGKRFAIADEKIVKTIEKYGNTSASTIPIAICELNKSHAVKDGETLLLVAFGGGLTWGAALLKNQCLFQ